MWSAAAGWYPHHRPNRGALPCWLSLTIVLAFYSTSEISFTIAFFNEFSDPHPLSFLNYIIDVLFLVNVILHFSTGYAERGEKVLDRESIVYYPHLQGVLEMACCINRHHPGRHRLQPTRT